MSTPQEESAGSHLADSLYSILEKETGPEQEPGEPEETRTPGLFEFHDNRGRNVSLCHGNTMARRNDSYNQGMVMSAKPLPRDTLFQVKILFGFIYLFICQIQYIIILYTDMNLCLASHKRFESF